MKILLGIILASVVGYLWGFAYWGASDFPYQAWKQTANADDAAAAQSLLAHFPEEGTYFVPGWYNEEEQLNALHESGPKAFVHITSVDGGPMQDPKIMAWGFAQIAATVFLLAMLLKMASPALESYVSRVGFVTLAGVMAAVMVEMADATWWSISLDWKLYQALYDISFAFVVGLVLAIFIRGKSPAVI